MNRIARTAHLRRTRIARAVVCAAVAGGLALGLGACSESVDRSVGEAVDEAVDETYEVTYEVTGTTVDEIQFHGGGGKAMEPKIETVKSPTLPWRKTVTLRGIMPSAVMPIALDGGAADVACTITYKGKVVEEAKGEALLTGGGCIAVSPVTG
ncbi:MmpS family transport accessory protein [Streptomyces sp. NPDC060022]|uniref:MmpS family transport accessory protein n=1 Tax=Streptomyces sp. NPDC060022 TaxID=3347039 RepID=UPI00368CFD72